MIITAKYANHANTGTGTTVFPVAISFCVVRVVCGLSVGWQSRRHGYNACNGNWSTHYYYHADGNGNITYLMAAGEGLAASYRYDAYGNLVGAGGSLAVANVYRFSSKEQHERSGLYYYGYRFYSPNWQRWPNQDPIQELGGKNLYSFVANNPLNNSDAFGLESQSDDKGFWGGAWDWMKDVPSRVKDAAACVKQWCKSKVPGIGSAGAGAAGKVIGGVADAAKAGPGMTAIAAMEAACRKCKQCEGDCDEDGSCARACKHCEDAKAKMGGHIGGL